jgi:hypothetical protein
VQVDYASGDEAVEVEVSAHPPPEQPGFAPGGDFDGWAADPAGTTRMRALGGGRGGLGLILMHRCADQVRFDPKRHSVILRKLRVPDPGPARPGAPGSA